MVVHGNCVLWSPAKDGRALLVPQGCGEPVFYFAWDKGQPLMLVNASVPGDFEASARRAATRMRRLLYSAALRDVHREG